MSKYSSCYPPGSSVVTALILVPQTYTGISVNVGDICHDSVNYFIHDLVFLLLLLFNIYKEQSHS